MIRLIRSRLSYKVAVAASALTLVFALVAGAAVYVVMSLQIKSQVDTVLSSEAALRAEKVADLVEGISASFRTLSSSAVILDAIGGDAGKGYMASMIADMDEVNGVAIAVVAVDRSGRVLAASRPDEPRSVDAWAADMVAQARPRARIAVDSDGPVLVVGLPVAPRGALANGAGSGQGGLVYRISLADLGRRARSPAGTGIGEVVLHEGRERHIVALGHAIPADHPLVKEAAVRLPAVLAQTRMSVRVAAEKSALSVPLGRLATSMFAIGLVITLLVVALSLAMGQRLTRALSRLTEAATGFGFGRGDRLAFSVGAEAGDDNDEIARLGLAFAGMVTRLDGAYQDLERRSQTLLSNAERVAQVGSAVWDLGSGRHLWSGQFHTVLGLAPDDAQPGLGSFFDRAHPDDRAQLKAVLDNAIAASPQDRAGSLVEDFRIVRADGDERVVQMRGQIAWDRKGIPERMDLTLQDITERKLLERKLDGLVHELRRSNEELEQFAYVASHDLRQPLRVVGSYVTLIEEAIEDQLDGETREFMDFIRDGVRRMDLLITDLLAYSRVGRSSKDGPVDTGRALDLALIDLQVEIDGAHARIRHPKRMPVVLGDASEMARLFQNLVGNGVKYRALDRVSEVEIGCVDSGAMWEFFVRDNGIGITADHLERVFGIFQRLHARDEYEGTGIGLAICKKVVERQGGRIWIDSEPGHQTTFRFTWPKLSRSVELSSFNNNATLD